MSYMYVNTPVGETVNVRKAASTSSAIVGRLSRGTRVTTDFHDDSGFWHITSPLTGYIMDTFLTTTEIESGSSNPSHPYDEFSAYGPSTQVLRRGSQGTAVTNLQISLNSLAFLLSDDGHPDSCIDGIFGADTEGAVLDYQADRRLTADGIVGNATKAQLWADHGSKHPSSLTCV